MTTQITITLPDETYLRAQRFAHLANRDIASVLADTVIGALPAMSQQIDHLEAIATLTDEQILALTELQMEPEQDQRLSTLLSEQQSSPLTAEELEELEGLMQIYREGLLRTSPPKPPSLTMAVGMGAIANASPSRAMSAPDGTLTIAQTSPVWLPISSIWATSSTSLKIPQNVERRSSKPGCSPSKC
jgi:hypothetical protein